MGNSGVQVYENEEKTFSRWSKKAIIGYIEQEIEHGRLLLKCSLEVLKGLPADALKNVCLKQEPEYCTRRLIDDVHIQELTDEDLQKAVIVYKEQKREQKKKLKEEKELKEKWECSFMVRQKINGHQKTKQVTEIGIIRNGWFIRSDGSKKSIHAYDFSKIRRYVEKDGIYVPVKKYQELPKEYIGKSERKSLILFGGSGVEDEHLVNQMRFPENGDYEAYIAEGEDVDMGGTSDVKKLGEFAFWLDIYDDKGLVKTFKAERIIVYEKGYDYTIHLINGVPRVKLYKNVDICDLESIMEKGILSLDVCKNYNWDTRRAPNATDCVYLFSPIEGECSAHPGYGVALIETDIKDVHRSEILRCDEHKGKYIEYTTEMVKPEQITRILIPEIFKSRIHLSKSIEQKIEWCGMTADIYGKNGYEAASDEVLKQFAETAEIEKANMRNFLWGFDKNNKVIALYNINYIF